MSEKPLSWAERFYLVFERRGLLAKVFARLYRLSFRPKWVARLWGRGRREWSTRMYDEQLEKDGLL